eukprot:8685085-Pyramimonas_sp.AAC.1
MPPGGGGGGLTWPQQSLSKAFRLQETCPSSLLDAATCPPLTLRRCCQQPARKKTRSGAWSAT